MSDLTPATEPVESTEPVEGLSNLRIKFEGKFKSITTFEWNEIPSFAVITGINGTGKSQLLELIHNTIINNPQSPERVIITGRNIVRHEVTFLRGEWQLQGTTRVSLATVQQLRESHYNAFRNPNNYHNIQSSQPRLYEAFQLVIRETGKQPEMISFEEFSEIFPEILVEEESHLSTKIGEIFLN